MIQFYLLLLAIAAIPVAMVLPALMQKNNRHGVDSDRLNIEIARSRIDEVQQHLENDADRETAEKELQITLLDDLQGTANPGNKTMHIPAVGNFLLLCMIPFASIVIYALIGNPQFAVNGNLPHAGNPNAVENLDINVLIEQLEQKIAQEPENPKGWEIAGRTYMGVGNYRKAENAYRELNKLVVGNPDFLTAWADAAIMNHGGHTAEAGKLVEDALSIDPFHANALWIAGLGAQSTGRHTAAVDYFSRLLPLLGDDQDSIDRVNQLIKSSQAISADAAQSASTSDTTKAGRSITVTLDIQPEIRQQVGDAAVVFIIAKAESGPAAPLAVSRHTVAELPLQTTLTAAMAMIPELTIAAFDRIAVSARVSLSGNAARQKGDFISDSVSIAKDDHEQAVNLIIAHQVSE